MIHYCRNDCGMVTRGWRTELHTNRPATIIHIVIKCCALHKEPREIPKLPGCVAIKESKLVVYLGRYVIIGATK